MISNSNCMFASFVDAFDFIGPIKLRTFSGQLWAVFGELQHDGPYHLFVLIGVTPTYDPSAHGSKCP
jgi:hypothetical protein